MIIIDNSEVPYVPKQEKQKDTYSLLQKTENSDFIYSLQLVADLHFPMEDVWGYEIWEKNNESSPLHYDKDESLYERRDILSYPICSIIYYYEVKDLVGGELVSPGNWSVTPKHNRLVIFEPGVPHEVLAFTGTRKAVLVNFWRERLGTIPKNFP